mmetsp:Transcript_25680/g.60506  ORF Transcript_25680/g.60506 Transcript_25680/m.60506 type:complete len:122 (-) Transcript_25680:151-516(-)
MHSHFELLQNSTADSDANGIHSSPVQFVRTWYSANYTSSIPYKTPSLLEINLVFTWPKKHSRSPPQDVQAQDHRWRRINSDSIQRSQTRDITHVYRQVITKRNKLSILYRVYRNAWMTTST